LRQLLELQKVKLNGRKNRKRKHFKRAWFIRDVLAQEKIIDMSAVKDLEKIVNEYPEFAKK